MMRLLVPLLLWSVCVGQDPMLKPTKPAFTFHPAVVSGWWDYSQATHLTGAGKAVRLFDKLKLRHQTATQRTYETFTITEPGVAVHGGVRAYSGKTHGDFWVRVVYGHRGTSKVTWQRLNLSVTGAVAVSIDKALGQVGHGQGVLVRWRYDFAKKHRVPMRLERRRASGLAPPPYFIIPEKPSWFVVPAPVPVAIPAPYAQTSMVPCYPGRTGDQENFGFNHILADLWSSTNREQEWFRLLATEAGRPGHWFNEDGTLVLDDTPTTNLLVGGADLHPKSKGYNTQAWFKTSGDWVARSPRGYRWRGWDDQHWGAGPLCQAVWLYGDLGLLWECEHLAATWLFSSPFESRGTTHFQPNNARANGRTIQSGACLYWALLDWAPELAERVRNRLLRLLELQIVKWQAEGPIVKRGQASVWMHAEWVNGLTAAVNLPMPDALRRKTAIVGTQIAQWILGAFKKFHDDTYWGIPYYVDAKGLPIVDEPTGKGLISWCIGAIQLLNDNIDPSVTVAERAKAASILKQWITDRDPPVGGGFPRWMEWLVR